MTILENNQENCISVCDEQYVLRTPEFLYICDSEEEVRAKFLELYPIEENGTED